MVKGQRQAAFAASRYRAAGPRLERNAENLSLAIFSFGEMLFASAVCSPHAPTNNSEISTIEENHMRFQNNGMQ
jgi:hypothetical protein